MAYETEDDYRYVESKDKIPVTGDGIGRNWEDDEIHEAVETGEQKLENDVNNGEQIDSPQQIHGEAAATWATYKLVLGMKAPDSATRGDMLDEGSERMAFADRLNRMYSSYVDSILGTGEDASHEVTFRTFDY